jgi:pantothenate kinase
MTMTALQANGEKRKGKRFASMAFANNVKRIATAVMPLSNVLREVVNKFLAFARQPRIVRVTKNAAATVVALNASQTTSVQTVKSARAEAVWPRLSVPRMQTVLMDKFASRVAVLAPRHANLIPYTSDTTTRV